MDRITAQRIALKGLYDASPEEGHILEIIAGYGEQFPMEEYGNFMNLQLITPGYVDFGSSPFHFRITAKGKTFVESLGDQTPVKPETTEEVLMPSLKPATDASRDAVLQQPLFKSPGLDGDIPFISYGIDMPDRFLPLRPGDSPDTQEEIHRACITNLKTIRPAVHEVDMGGFKMLVCTGDYYTCEKILDPEFMQSLQHRLGAALLAVALPRKGTMYVTSGLQPTEVLGKFELVAAMKYGEQEQAPPLSKTIFTVQDGQLAGIIRISREATGTPPASPKNEQKPGFFGKLFGKK